jgi:hypothetical protein
VTKAKRKWSCIDVRMEPAVEEKEPAVQGKGRRMPAKGQSEPAGHASQYVDADCDANVPAAQAMQTEEARADV